MKLTLCYAPIACSLVPLINLNEVGASFEVRKINLRKGDNMTSDYLAMNPLHKVPVLIVDGRALTENVAINTYIARTYPAAKLLPSNSMDELEAISMMGWFSGGLHPHLTRIFNPTRFCDAPGSEEATRALAKKALEENFAAADKRLAGREFFFDHFTAPDAHFFWCTRRATQDRFQGGRLCERRCAPQSPTSTRQREKRARVREGDDGGVRKGVKRTIMCRFLVREFGSRGARGTKTCHLWSAVRM